MNLWTQLVRLRKKVKLRQNKGDRNRYVKDVFTSTWGSCIGWLSIFTYRSRILDRAYEECWSKANPIEVINTWVISFRSLGGPFCILTNSRLILKCVSYIGHNESLWCFFSSAYMFRHRPTSCLSMYIITLKIIHNDLSNIIINNTAPICNSFFPLTVNFTCVWLCVSVIVCVCDCV